MTPRLHSMFFLGAALAATGCVSVLPEATPPAPRYLIEPVAEFDPGPSVSWSLGVEDPVSTRVYDSVKIALVREPGRVEYYAKGEWADRAPRLFQAALIRSFENTGRILGIGDRTMLPISNFVLQTDIRKIQAEYTDGKPTARISIFVRIANGRGKVYAAKLFDESVEAREDSVAAVAAAFDQSVTKAIAEIVDWTIEQGDEVQAK